MTDDLRGWRARPLPQRMVLAGRLVRLEPLDPATHGDALFAASMADGAAERHRYLAEEPMTRDAFDDLGYRRYEWKCDDRNAPSKHAALRFGFTYEGTFRQDMVVKGENRDTAWFAITDRDWPARRRALEAWLDPENFDANGHQKRPLAGFHAAV